MKLKEIPPYSLRCPTEAEGAPRKNTKKKNKQGDRKPNSKSIIKPIIISEKADNVYVPQRNI